LGREEEKVHSSAIQRVKEQGVTQGNTTALFHAIHFACAGFEFQSSQRKRWQGGVLLHFPNINPSHSGNCFADWQEGSDWSLQEMAAEHSGQNPGWWRRRREFCELRVRIFS
jgi:hypothetical protein